MQRAIVPVAFRKTFKIMLHGRPGLYLPYKILQCGNKAVLVIGQNMILLAEVFHIHFFSIAVDDGMSEHRNHHAPDAPERMQDAVPVVAAKLFGTIHELMDGKVIFDPATPFLNGDLRMNNRVHDLKLAQLLLIEVEIIRVQDDVVGIFHDIMKG